MPQPCWHVRGRPLWAHVLPSGGSFLLPSPPPTNGGILSSRGQATPGSALQPLPRVAGSHVNKEPSGLPGFWPHHRKERRASEAGSLEHAQLRGHGHVASPLWAQDLHTAAARPSPSPTRAWGRARLPLCPSALTPASAHVGSEEGPGVTWPGSRRQATARPSPTTLSEAVCKNDTWRHSWSSCPTAELGPHPLPTITPPSARCGAVPALGEPLEGNSRPSLPSRRECRQSPNLPRGPRAASKLCPLLQGASPGRVKPARWTLPPGLGPQSPR